MTVGVGTTPFGFPASIDAMPLTSRCHILSFDSNGEEARSIHLI